MFILGLAVACFIGAIIVYSLLASKDDGQGGPQGGDY